MTVLRKRVNRETSGFQWIDNYGEALAESEHGKWHSSFLGIAVEVYALTAEIFAVKSLRFRW